MRIATRRLNCTAKHKSTIDDKPALSSASVHPLERRPEIGNVI